MLSKLIKIVPVLLVIYVSASAQINSGIGYMHGTYKKGDTITEYQADPKKDNHPQVTVIKETKLTPAEAAKYEGKSSPSPASASAAPAQSDTSAKDTSAQTTAAVTDSGSSPAAMSTLIISSSTTCDCINLNIIYAALILLCFAFLLSTYLLMQSIKDEQRSALISVLHGLIVTAGMTLFIIYCIFHTLPVVSLSVLIIATLCSRVLLFNDVTGQQSPKWLAVVQVALSAVGTALLIMFTYGR